MKPCKYGHLERYANGKCAVCARAALKKWQEVNRDKARAASNRWKKANPEKSRQIEQAWRAANPDKVKALKKRYREKYPKKVAASSKKWREQNRELKNEITRRCYNAKPEQYRVAYKRKREQDPVRYKAVDAARTRRRQAMKLQRTPAWLTEDDFWLIEQAYELAARRTELFGFPWHVDHVVPLQGKAVSGLHVPWNLQVIPGVENIRKGAKLHVS